MNLRESLVDHITAILREADVAESAAAATLIADAVIAEGAGGLHGRRKRAIGRRPPHARGTRREGSTRAIPVCGAWRRQSKTGLVRRWRRPPYVFRARYVAQYVTTVADSTATRTYGSRYVFASLDQNEASFISRADISLSPKMSLQFCAEPFVGTGRYRDYREFQLPGAFDFLEYGTETGTVVRDATEGTRTVDPDGAGPARSFVLYDGDYSAKTLQTKSVFRWEWRPGSTIYLAWTRARWSGSTENVFLVKATWWLSPTLTRR